MRYGPLPTTPSPPCSVHPNLVHNSSGYHVIPAQHSSVGAILMISITTR